MASLIKRKKANFGSAVLRSLMAHAAKDRQRQETKAKPFRLSWRGKRQPDKRLRKLNFLFLGFGFGVIDWLGGGSGGVSDLCDSFHLVSNNVSDIGGKIVEANFSALF